MKGAPYYININSGLLTNRWRRLLMLKDEDDLLGQNEAVTTANASSYFAQLADWLDEVCLELGPDNRREIAKLQRIIDDLLFLYTQYEIKKKPGFLKPTERPPAKS